MRRAVDKTHFSGQTAGAHDMQGHALACSVLGHRKAARDHQVQHMVDFALAQQDLILFQRARTHRLLKKSAVALGKILRQRRVLDEV